MKQKITAFVLLVCLILCGCEGRNGDNFETESSVTGTKTAAETFSADNAAETTTGSIDKHNEKSTATTPSTNTSQSETQPQNVADSINSDIFIDEAPAETVAAQQKTAADSTTSDESTAENSGILSDDGLNWSPLEPVN